MLIWDDEKPKKRGQSAKDDDAEEPPKEAD